MHVEENKMSVSKKPASHSCTMQTLCKKNDKQEIINEVKYEPLLILPLTSHDNPTSLTDLYSSYPDMNNIKEEKDELENSNIEEKPHSERLEEVFHSSNTEMFRGEVDANLFPQIKEDKDESQSDSEGQLNIKVVEVYGNSHELYNGINEKGSSDVNSEQSSRIEIQEKLCEKTEFYSSDVLSKRIIQSKELEHNQCEPKLKKVGMRSKNKSVCCICGSEFTKASKLKYHMRIHSGEKPFSCNQCNAVFSQSNDLKNHQRIHTGERPYKCDQCDSSFAQTGSLKNHQRIHTGDKPYKCHLCDSAFTRSSSLKTHQKIHSGEKPFKCNECDAAFSQSSHLKMHNRIHTGEKPYKCAECDAMFIQSSDLKKHMRSHSGEKPFKCEQCAATFTLLSSLKRHRKLHTDEK